MPPHTPSPAYLRQPTSDSSQGRRPQPPNQLPPPVSQYRGRNAPTGRTVRIADSGPSYSSAQPNRAPTRSGTKLGRSKTLTRPDRAQQPAPLINPHQALLSVQGGGKQGVISVSVNGPPWYDPWSLFAHLVTFWAPPFFLGWIGKKDKPTRQAWREKMALCFIALLMGGFVGFATVGLNRTLCPEKGGSNPDAFMRLGENAGYVGIDGWQFSVSDYVVTGGINLFDYAKQLSGQDVSFLFDRNTRRNQLYPSCANNNNAYATANLCANATAGANAACALPEPNDNTFNQLKLKNATVQVGYAWEQVSTLAGLMVLDGHVLNMAPYLYAHPQPIPNDPVDAAIRYVLTVMNPSGGKDGTRLFYNRNSLRNSVPCIVDRYAAGHIDKVTPGCFASQLFLYFSLVVIMSVVLARFFMALVFSWFLSHRLVKTPRNLRRKVKSPGVLPEGAINEVGNQAGVAPWINKDGGGKLQKRMPNEKANKAADAQGMINMASIGSELFCICLVTCYSEGAEGIGNTLDSISATDYADARKLLFVVCDGMITGSGEKMSTPDICVGMLEADPRFGNPQPMSYLAVAAGAKEHNMSMVYAGHYTNVKGRRTPMIVIVKCGTPEEATDKKPGNRGKRDSQMILMNFFSRVTYNDRMTPLDYDLFRKIQALMGVTPDFFEVCLMVDADTKVYKDSLKHLVNTMQHDWLIMGVCGETRIANKRQSWVTAIQVYEYFISHHLAKAFESVFGGVTCLPGCFSMYRIKARRYSDGDWIPILAQPEICREYSQSTVTTLHQKNLLLLGEDRFLTTLMIRTFPNRKMMFCPQAKCRTVAPDTFAVLLSQRRRWINSTIHNLMELVRVPNLCGTFCFSMQFVVFMELIGTVVLPVAICLTYSLIVAYVLDPPKDFASAIPLMLLTAVLGLPAVLILLTSRKVVYVGWMLIYLLALPVWNLVLPVWAFAHFDDFSWGETRKVAGEGKDKGHGDGHGGAIAANTVPLRRWADWERSRLRKAKREEKRKQEFAAAFGTKKFHNDQDPFDGRPDHSDAASVSTYEDDRWGVQIGHYEESRDIPPPIGLFNAPSTMGHGTEEAIAANDMERMLEGGWDDESPPRTDEFEGGRQVNYGNGYESSQNYGQRPQPSHSQHSYPSAPTRKLYALQDDGPIQQQQGDYGGGSDRRDFSISSYGERPGASSPPPTAQQDDYGYYDSSRQGQSSAVESNWGKGHMHKRSNSQGGRYAGYGQGYRGDV